MPTEPTNAMRPGMGLLLDILRERAPQSASEAEWNAVFELCGEHRVLQWVADRLRRSDLALPEAIQRRLEIIHSESIFYASLRTAELKELIVAFRAEAIPVIPLKGGFFGERIYGARRLRPSMDHDLLVHEKDMPAARHLLAERGFHLYEDDNGYHEMWHRGEARVELHRDVAKRDSFNFHVERAWQFAEWDSYDGEPVLRLCPSDELLYICLHGAKHCFESLGHVLDVALMLEILSSEQSSARFAFSAESVVRPETKPLLGVLMLGCALAKRIRPDSVVPLMPGVSSGVQARMSEMAEEHWQQLQTQPRTKLRLPYIHRFHRRTRITLLSRVWRLLLDYRDAGKFVMEVDDAHATRIGAEKRIGWIVRGVRCFRPLRGYADSESYTDSKTAEE